MPKNLNITHAHLRRDYASKGLIEKRMKPMPLQQFKLWFSEAVASKLPDANAFVLATVDKKLRPSARVLLMKGFDSRGIQFFTNYSSAKGEQIKQRPFGEAVFFWGSLNRQVRLQGSIVKLSRKVSLAYFQSRPLLAQIAASVSQQSRGIKSRELLERQFRSAEIKCRSDSPRLPQEWGGYELRVEKAEFWQGRPNRLHDRVVYQHRSKTGRWHKVRLQP